MRRAKPFLNAVRWILIAALGVGSPGTAAVQAAIASTEGILFIETDPAGALAFVDGRPHGSTPLDVHGLTPGNHRVLVVKDGYLENSRSVSLRAGQKRAVQVRLTMGSNSIRSSVQVEGKGQGKSGGGGKKWALIGAGAVVAGAGVYLATHRNKAPLPGSINVSAANALMSATEVTFASQGATDPDNDPLTYTWEFGDGGTATGQTATHVFRSAGTFTAKLTVSDGKKSASTNAGPVTVKSMQGAWRGIFNVSNIDTFNLTQNDTTIGGTFNHTWANRNYSAPNSTIVGSSRVSAPRRVVIEASIPTYYLGAFFGTYVVTFSCEMNESITTCAGTVSGRNGNFFSYPFSMSRQ